MSDEVSIGRRVGSVDISPQFSNYSKVIIKVDKDTAIEAGDDNGRTLELENPFGTQEMAQSILNRLQGFQYQPYTAGNVLLDPAAEMGDAANIRGAYGGIYSRTRSFGKLMRADISAPYDEEIDHEYEFESPEQREFTRQIDDVRASLIIANNRIDASVSKIGGESSTFGWSLTADAHTWYSDGNEVMKVNADGLSVTGEVKATSGKIGGFTIGASAIYNNIKKFGGSQSSGVYLGTDGIQLGQGVKISSSGRAEFTNISADSMTLTGTLNVGGSNIAANTLRSGAASAYSNGSFWSAGATGGQNYTSATQSAEGAPTRFYVKTLSGTNIAASNSISSPKFIFDGATLVKRYVGLKNSSGNTQYFSLVCYA